MKKFRYTLLTAFVFGLMIMTSNTAKAQLTDGVFPAAGTPSNPKVEATWNHYYNYQGISELTERIAKAYPDLAKRTSIGKSYEGKDIWMLTVSNFKNGDPDRKPAIYIDGNIHSNEIQGTEMSLYTAWYLTESFGNVKFITELLNDKTFYIVPTINPDAREHYMTEPNTGSSPRSGLKPIDDDGDGLVDEDQPDDLDGNGSITQMRRKNPRGNFRAHPTYPNMMVRVPDDEFGDYEYLGSEGIDNDNDGRINEDRVGYYDPNRDWGWNWQPNHIQGGAHKYPFSLPETRAVMDFVMKRPNIAAAQSYHNSGGMILRGPGVAEDISTYNRQDVQVYDAIGEMGERLIPGYRYLVVYDDLYDVFGGELDWFYGFVEYLHIPMSCGPATKCSKATTDQLQILMSSTSIYYLVMLCRNGQNMITHNMERSRSVDSRKTSVVLIRDSCWNKVLTEIWHLRSIMLITLLNLLSTRSLRRILVVV